MNESSSFSGGPKARASRGSTRNGPGNDKPRQRTYRLPTEERLTRSAIHYLDRYASSVSNLRSVLKRKVSRAARSHDKDPEEFSELIELVVAKCERSGMVNDTDYAATKVASLRRRGRSQRQIEAQLKSKGVADETLYKALDAHDSDDWNAAQTYARRRKLGPWRTRGPLAEFRQKDMAALCRAGFSYDIARKIMALEPDAEPYR
ncbi:MAG: RecX family transcriptional regulator [Rhodobacteraceae bacterium]|nr:RecX family transcriptional regulator [Paracoccaceae bacterium]